MYQWCELKSCQGKNKNLTALKSNSNTVWFNFQTYIIFSISLVSLVTLRSSGTDILYGCHLLLDVCIIYFISCDCIMNSSLSVLAVDDRHVAFCEYNGSVARIFCVAVATLANENLLERASDNDLLLCRKSTSNKTCYRQ